MKPTRLLLAVSLLALLFAAQWYKRSFNQVEAENARLHLELERLREQVKLAKWEKQTLERKHRPDRVGQTSAGYAGMFRSSVNMLER